jgi:23S rRNA pseudouridine1911/1915/1917 synthase
MARAVAKGSPRLLPPHRPRILDETAEYLVVEKPPFLAAHPTRPGETGTLWDELRGILAFELATGGQVSLINRLDRETSGITLVAKTQAAARHFAMLMMAGAFRKEYLAIVFGHTPPEWTVDGALARQADVEPFRVYVRQIIHPEGAVAFTAFRTERHFTREGRPFSLVRAFPKTGRMHQIRVHLASSGHPIVGDEANYLEFLGTGWTPSMAERLLLPRQALHATRLSVENLDWHAPLPTDLCAWLPPASVHAL